VKVNSLPIAERKTKVAHQKEGGGKIGPLYTLSEVGKGTESWGKYWASVIFSGVRRRGKKRNKARYRKKKRAGESPQFQIILFTKRGKKNEIRKEGINNTRSLGRKEDGRVPAPFCRTFIGGEKKRGERITEVKEEGRGREGSSSCNLLRSSQGKGRRGKKKKRRIWAFGQGRGGGLLS